MKGISEYVTILLILIVAVTSVSILWLAFHGYFKQITSSEETSTLGKVLSSCMKIESVRNDKVYLRNCGDGLITNDTLSVFIDEEPFEFEMTPDSIKKGDIAEMNINGLWRLNVGDHKIKISNPSGKVERFVKAELPDSCVLALNFDEGEGNITYDESGYGNNGTIYQGLPSTEYSPDSNGYIRDWLVIGMFDEADCACDAGICDAFVDETSNLKYPGLTENGKTWFEHNNADNYINLDNEVFDPSIGNNFVVAYAFVFIYSPTTRNVQLRIGSDDGVKAWLNGNLVDDNGFACRGASPDQDIISVTLNSGYNYLLLRVGESSGGWGFYTRFTDQSGNPQTDLKIYLDSRIIKWVNGKFGKALQFDGVDDGVNISKSQTFNFSNNSFTISAWIKNSGLNGVILQQRDKTDIDGEYQLAIDNGRISFWLYYEGDWQFYNFFSDKLVNDSLWHHVVVVRNDTNGYIYLDGSLENIQTHSVLPVNGNLSLSIGYDRRDESNYFNGIIDSVRIYNESLTPDEIVSLTLGELT